MTAVTLPAETQRRTRGHVFYPPKAVLRRIPPLYGTESTPLDDKVLHVKFFTGPWTWYVAELDPDTGEAFGLTSFGGFGYPTEEWGYFSLPELEQVRPSGSLTEVGTVGPGQSGVTHVGTLKWLVERDCYWSPVPARRVLDGSTS